MFYLENQCKSSRRYYKSKLLNICRLAWWKSLGAIFIHAVIRFCQEICSTRSSTHWHVKLHDKSHDKSWRAISFLYVVTNIVRTLLNLFCKLYTWKHDEQTLNGAQYGFQVNKTKKALVSNHKDHIYCTKHNSVTNVY